MSGYYEFSGPESLEAMMGMGFGFVMGIALLAAVISLALGVAIYIFQSLSYYRIAKRRGIHNPWLAWIPLGNMWILGSISDQFQYVKKGKVRNRRKVLLWMTVALYVLMIPVAVAEVALGIKMAAGASEGVMATSGVIGMCSFVMFVITLVASIFQYIAYYDLYTSCQPDNSVMYLVLSIVFPITLPIFLFVCRNQDEGMPPRRQAAPTQIPVQLQREEETVRCDEVTDADFETENTEE